MRQAVREEIEAGLDEFEATLPEPEADPVTANLVTKYNVADATIATLREKYSGLTIAGVEDKKGYALVHSARMEIKELRIEVDKKRKVLKADALEYGRKVDKEAARIIGQLEPIEDHLAAEEKRIDAENERIKAEAQRAKEAKLQARIDALTALGAPASVAELTTMTDMAFEFCLANAKDAFEAREKIRIAGEEALRLQAEREAKEAAEREAAAQAEKDRIAKEEADRIAAVRAEQAKEAERLAAERAEHEKEKAELAKAQAALDAEKRKVEQAAREEQIRKDAEAKAKADAERAVQAEALRKEQEAAAEKSKQEAEAKRKAQAEAARPDQAKLMALAEVIRGTAWPKMTTPDGNAALVKIQDAGARFAKFVEAEAAALAPKVMG